MKVAAETNAPETEKVVPVKLKVGMCPTLAVYLTQDGSFIMKLRSNTRAMGYFMYVDTSDLSVRCTTGLGIGPPIAAEEPQSHTVSICKYSPPPPKMTKSGLDVWAALNSISCVTPFFCPICLCCSPTIFNTMPSGFPPLDPSDLPPLPPISSALPAMPIAPIPQAPQLSNANVVFPLIECVTTQWGYFYEGRLY